jgi:predicted ATPase/DNA-binding winged helix-turn-helix (wHTH) protein
LDVGRQRLERDGTEIPLPKLSFDFLLALVRAAPNVVLYDELMRQVWEGLIVQPETISQRAKLLRDALGDDAQLIRGLRGRGYVLACSVERLPVEDLQPSLSRSTEADDATARASLPCASDALIGREYDVEALQRWLAAHRLVTVLGAGGIGKTRVAMEVARLLVGSFEHGVWWVDVGALSSEDRIAPAIANAARLQLSDGDAPALLARALAARRTLLVLDNCEHLTAGVARIVQSLLVDAIDTRVLVTSQQALHLSGEQLYRLGTLTVPPPGATLAEARGYSAIQLLEQRAQAIDRRFALSGGNIAEAVDLCRRLDGIALAIEMAAARLPTLGLGELRRHLNERLQLLRGSRHSGPARQQTLRATLAWSHSLLDANEQAALRRLSVFAGSFGLDAARRVAANDGLDTLAAIDALTGLVDKSLIQVDQFDPPRYRMLESTRLYAREALHDAGEWVPTAQRHGVAMVELAEKAEAAFWTEPDAAWLERYALEYDDLQEAFQKACERRDADIAAITGNALRRLDEMRNVHAPIRQRAECARTLLSAASERAQAWLWNCVAPHSVIAVTVVPRLTAAREAVAAWERLNDAPQLYIALGILAGQLARAGDHEQARAVLARARALEDPAWPPRRRMRGAEHAAAVCNYRGDAAGYRAHTRVELALAEQGGAPRTAAWARLKLADAALMAGDMDEAIALGEQAVAQLSALDQPSHLGLALSNLSEALLVAGQPSRAREIAARALPLMRQNEWGHMVLDTIALLGARNGDVEASARLLGYTDGHYAKNEEQRQPNESRLAELAATTLAATIGAERRDQLRSEGRGIGEQQAWALAAVLLASEQRTDAAAPTAESVPARKRLTLLRR